MIPLIIPYFNQPTYLTTLAWWWHWYRPNDPVFVLDNASDGPPVLPPWCKVIRYEKNKAWENLRHFIDTRIKGQYGHYVISDPDILPHPSTPPDFLDVMKDCLDVRGYHHVGFGLIADDIPEWVPPAIRDDAIRNEAFVAGTATVIEHNGRKIPAWKAPIDTTFALYSTANSGWSSPMPGDDWGNSLRIFRAFHLNWYIPEHPNAEMDRYFSTARGGRDGEKGSACRNHYRPAKYNDRINEEWKLGAEDPK